MMFILVIRKSRHRERKALARGPTPPCSPNRIHHFKGFWLEVTHVTSTHVSLAKGSPITLPEFKKGRKSSSITHVEVEALNIYEQTWCCPRPLWCRQLHEGRTLSYLSPTPWHLAQGLLQRETFRSVCSVDHRTYAVPTVHINSESLWGVGYHYFSAPVHGPAPGTDAH